MSRIRFLSMPKYVRSTPYLYSTKKGYLECEERVLCYLLDCHAVPVLVQVLVQEVTRDKETQWTKNHP